MFSFNSFAAGFVLGFGSGVGFRALAENDFEPMKDVLRTGVVIAQKVGDSVVESFGRMRESIQDIRSQVRAERATRVNSRGEKTASTSTRSSKGRKGRASNRKAEVLHA